MYSGIAAGLLVFTGIWHATEWLMDGRRRDTLALVPFGLAYLVLGVLIVTLTGGAATLVVAAVLPALGAALALRSLGRIAVRNWVMWTFIAVDVLIVLALILGGLGA